MKYSIVTSLFGYYDTLKEPEGVDPNAEYICITDRDDLTSDVWKIVIDKFDEDMNGLQKAFTVKYDGLFNYISNDSEYIVRLDASIQIHKSLEPIVKYLKDKNYLCALMLHPERSDMIDEYDTWESLRNHPHAFKETFIKEMQERNFNIHNTGLVETTFQIYRNCDVIRHMIKDISDIIKKTSNYSDNNDQCYYTYVLSKYIDIIKILFVNRQVISSDFMDLCFHYSDKIVYEDHHHARGPLGEFIYDIDLPMTHKLFGKNRDIHFF